jgi:hypothetical protein
MFHIYLEHLSSWAEIDEKELAGLGTQNERYFGWQLEGIPDNKLFILTLAHCYIILWL